MWKGISCSWVFNKWCTSWNMKIVMHKKMQLINSAEKWWFLILSKFVDSIPCSVFGLTFTKRVHLAVHLSQLYRHCWIIYLHQSRQLNLIIWVVLPNFADLVYWIYQFHSPCLLTLPISPVLSAEFTNFACLVCWIYHFYGSCQ